MTAAPKWIAVLVAVAVLAVAGPAMAQEEVDEEEQASKHFADGRKLYNEGKYHEAISALLKAYELRPAPPILLNIARTYEKLKNKKSALKFYKEFLLKARMTDPNRPMVEKVVKTLQAEVGGKTGAVTSDQGTDTPDVAPSAPEPGIKVRKARLPQIIHTPVDGAKLNHSVTLMAELPPNVTADYVVVHYRKGGDRRFRHVTMELQGEAYMAQIPPYHVTSTSIQYFIDAVRTQGSVMKIVARSGAKGMPHIIVVEGASKLRRPKRGSGPEDPTGGTPPSVTDDIKSPYRTWIWVSAGATVAFMGVAIAGTALAADRANAMEKRANDQSCKAGGFDRKLNKYVAGCTDYVSAPTRTFDGDVRDWEKEGKMFADMGVAFWVLTGVAAAATGGLYFMDRRWVKAERRRRAAGLSPSMRPRQDSGVRFTGGPWAGATGAGFVGRVDF